MISRVNTGNGAGWSNVQDNLHLGNDVCLKLYVHLKIYIHRECFTHSVFVTIEMLVYNTVLIQRLVCLFVRVSVSEYLWRYICGGQKGALSVFLGLSTYSFEAEFL